MTSPCALLEGFSQSLNKHCQRYHTCLRFLDLSFVPRSDVGPQDWVAISYPGHLPSILQTSRQPLIQTSRQPLTHSVTDSSCSSVTAGPCRDQGMHLSRALPLGGTQTLGSRSRELHANSGQSWVASLSQSWAKPSLTCSSSLLALCSNRSKLSAWSLLSFLLRAVVGH